jgi:uncharacterized RDD family membrane protein YckC
MASDGRWYPPHLHTSVTQAQAAGVNPAGAAQGAPRYSAQLTEQPQPGYVWPPPMPYGYTPPMYQQAPFGYASVPPTVSVDPLLRVPLASWGKRLGAILIDGWILIGFYFVLFAVIGAASHGSHTSTHRTVAPAAVIIGDIFAYCVFMIPAIVYYGIMNGSKKGQTVGKMALNISVRDAQTAGPIGFWRGVGRFSMEIVFQLLLFVPFVVDNLSPLWDARKQAWHDKVARSVVIDLRP